MEGLEISGVEKRKIGGASTGFDSFGQEETISEFDVCVGDQLDLEQDYLYKLRIQRERMQKLEKCYIQKQQQLSKQVNRTNQLISEIQRLTAFIPYKQKYEQLKQDYTELLSKYNIQQNELEIVKHQLSQVINQNSNTILRLKSELKSWKQSSVVNANQLEESLSDREEELRKLKRQWKDKQDQLVEQIKNLKNSNNKIKQQLQNESHFNDKQKDQMMYEIKSRDSVIQDLEKALEQARKANLEMKSEFSKFNQEVNGREQELSSMCAKLKNQLNQNKKAFTDKDSKIEQLLSDIKRNQQIIKEMKKQNENLKIQYKKACQLYECGNKKLKYESDSQINRLKILQKQLKDSIEDIMEVKNHLMQQNNKLRAILKKKEQAQKQRKQLLKTEFKQIDRIEKVIDRLE